MLTPVPDFSQASQFLRTLYPEIPGYLAVFCLPAGESYFSKSHDEAARIAISRAQQQNVYIGAGTFSTPLQQGRGRRSDVAAIPGVWADIDIAGEAHKAEHLPPTLEAALALLHTIPLTPTMLVHSGHGLQAWWLFKEPWVFDTDEERDKAQHLSTRWQRYILENAQRLHYTLDNTADLSRVLRIPGTINLKVANKPQPVRFREGGTRYSLDDFEHYLADLPDTALPSTKQVTTVLPATVPEGQRHAHLVSLAGTLRKRGMEEPEIYALLVATNNLRCHPPVPDARLRQIAESFTRYPAGDLPHRYSQKVLAQIEEPAAPTPEPAPQILSNVETAHIPPPKPIGEAARRGIIGTLIDLVEPHTEADPSWMIVLALCAAGNLLGRTAYIQRGGDRHYGNLFACAVGPTGAGAKGSAFNPILDFFRQIDAQWAENVTTGLSSGEGLIFSVRDPIWGKIKKKGPQKEADEGAEELLDAGVKDKRLLVVEPEFKSTLTVMARDGSTLSPTVRSAWDSGVLKVMNKNSPASATNAHISIVGNITPEELRSSLESGDINNGFANRFLWVWSQRSKKLPEGGLLWTVPQHPAYREATKALQLAASKAQEARFTLSPEASDLWGVNEAPDQGLYAHLTRPRHGILAKLTTRAAPMVLRIALIYALLDQASEIDVCHIDAALEVWRYSEETCLFVYGLVTGSQIADRILGQLRETPQGMSRKEINLFLSRNFNATQIREALHTLLEAKLATYSINPTRGRPIEIWRAAPPPSRA
jgi:hypothetical protein